MGLDIVLSGNVKDMILEKMNCLLILKENDYVLMFKLFSYTGVKFQELFKFM